MHESTATNPRLTPVAGGLEVHAPQVGLVGNVTASGTFAATGKSTLADVDAGDTMVAGTLETTGASTLAAVTATGLTVNGAASVTGSATLGATTADSLTVTGGTTLAATTATSLTVNGNEVGTDTGWVELTPATGWTKSALDGYITLSARRIDRFVEVRGTLARATWPDFSIFVSNLPVEFRPTSMVTGPSRHARIPNFFDVSPAGVMRIGNAGTTAISFNYSWMTG